MVPVKLILKGFKGIKAGLNRDVFELDLSEYKGRVVIYGPNGSGKSTILQNLHPYLIMPDRVKTYSQNSFNYYDECYLSDSQKVLIWKYNGTVYKSVIDINPQKKKTKAVLFEITPKGEIPIEDTKDGSVEAYINAVEKILGSPNLFFTSVFRSQDAKKLSGYSKTEMEDIFKELLNIELMEKYADNARQYVKHYMLTTSSIKNTLSEIDNTLKDEEKIKKEIQALEERKIKLNSDSKSLEDQIINLEKDIKNLELAIKENEIQIKRKDELIKLIDQYTKEIAQYNNTLNSKKEYYNSKYKSTLSQLKEYQQIVSQKNNVLISIKKLESDISIKPEIQKRLSELDTSIEALNTRYTEINRLKNILTQKSEEFLKLQNLRSKKTAELNTLLNINQNKATLLGRVPCQNTELPELCPLLKDAINAKNQIEDIKKQLTKLSDESPQELDLKNAILNLSKAIEDEQQVSTKLNELNKIRKDLFSKLKGLEPLERELGLCKERLIKISESEQKITYLENELANILHESKTSISEISDLINKKEIEIKQLTEELNSIQIQTNLISEYHTKSQILSKVRENLDSIKKELISIEYQLGKAHEMLSNLDKLHVKKKEFEGKIKQIEHEIEEWNNVAKIFNELIPLEIEDSGPEISNIANMLLESCYGPRFSITIITKIEAKSRKGEKDTFEIIVYDADRDSKKPLIYLSGGERVWIEEAITKAICLYNKFRSGKNFETLFTDERDGALDVLNRKKYFSMKQKVIELGQFFVEYVISHSNDALDEADYIIDLNTLAN